MKKKMRYFGAYWSNDSNSLDENSKRITKFLNYLKKFNDDFYSEWYMGANSRKKALKKKVTISEKEILNLLKKGVVQMPNGEILCHRLGFWNGTEDETNALSVSFTLGGDSNNCILRVGYSKKQQDFFGDKKNVKHIVNLLEKCWEPDFIKIDGEVIQD